MTFNSGTENRLTKGYRIMIKTDLEALTQALYLAIIAPSDAKAGQATTIANQIARHCNDKEIEIAKSLACAKAGL
jgi:hypothetical protein